MSKGHSPRPYHPATFGANYCRVFRKTDPAHSLVPGTVRRAMSPCCGAEPVVAGSAEGTQWYECSECRRPCDPILTKTNP